MGVDNINELRSVGLKATGPRLKILEIMASNRGRHMKPEDVYKALLDTNEDIGLATVYRVLTQFEAANLVKRHHFDGNQSVFELEEGGHHDHILCVRCGRVDEFTDEIIEKAQRDIATRAGYAMTDHSLNIYGVCPACQKSES